MTEMKKLFTRLAVISALAAPSLPAVAEEGAAVDLVPHSARYFLTLEEVKVPGGVGDFAGEMIYRLEKSCESWRLYHQLDFGMETRQGPLHVQSIYAVEEMLQGSQMRFKSIYRINGEEITHIAGTVSGATVSFSMPEESKLELDGDVLLPIQYHLSAFAGFRRGEKVQSHTYFGGETNMPYRVTDILGRPVPEREIDADGDKDLVSDVPNRVISSFFDPNEPDSEPTSVVSMNLHQNGILSWMSFDAGFVKTNASLTHVERLKAPDCNQGT